MSDLSVADQSGQNAGGRRTPSYTLAVMSFTVLVAVVFAGTRPFSLSHVQQVALESRGNAFEFLIYLVSTSACIAACVVNERPKRIEVSLVGMLLLLTYCGVSLLWSDAVFRGTVRYGQFALVTVAVILASQVLGREKIVGIIYRVLVILLAINLLSVLLVDGAVHSVADSDFQQLVGSWRGVHIHKNYTGAVAALTCLMAVSFILSGRWLHIAVLIPACILLVGSNSKASLAFALCVVVLLCTGKGLCAFFGRFAAKYLLVFVIILILTAILIEFDRVVVFLEDPYALTGRVELWNALGRYVDAYPWTGSGFGSFWRLGWESPILHLTDGWGSQTGSGHNGYLDAAVTLGIPGLVLTIVVLVVMPGFILISKLEANALYYDIFFCFVMFGLSHNSFESSFFYGNNAVFFCLLIGIFGLNSRAETAGGN